MPRPALLVVLALAVFPAVSFAQGSSSDPGPSPESQSDQENHRIFGIIPNYRTSPTLQDYQPLTPKQKFKVAVDDSLDRGSFMLAAAFGAQAQLSNSTPSFGHGLHAYVRYYSASLSDWVVGDFMTEAVFPTVLRQDPRYFRRGTGSNWSRLGYALGQILWTHTDSGGTQFNFSEVVGNAAAVGIANAYYPDNRNVSANVTKLGLQIGVDAASNVLKEFSPDLDRLFSRKKRETPPNPP